MCSSSGPSAAHVLAFPYMNSSASWLALVRTCTSWVRAKQDVGQRGGCGRYTVNATQWWGETAAAVAAPRWVSQHPGGCRSTQHPGGCRSAQVGVAAPRWVSQRP
eukprot:362068-Chlamydomonas_euryale.AAC.1